MLEALVFGPRNGETKPSVCGPPVVHRRLGRAALESSASETAAVRWDGVGRLFRVSDCRALCVCWPGNLSGLLIEKNVEQT